MITEDRVNTKPAKQSMRHPKTDRPWVRAGFARDGSQLWARATTAQIKRAEDENVPVHFIDVG